MKKLGIFGIVLFLTLYLSGMKIVFISGVSMEPTIKNGQVVLAMRVEPDGLEEMEIGIFENKDGDLIGHRVIYKTGSGYCFKGDNCRGFDDFVPKEKVRY